MPMTRFALAAFACLFACTSSFAVTQAESNAPALKPYVAKKIPPPSKDAKYVRSDGSILIAGQGQQERPAPELLPPELQV